MKTSYLTCKVKSCKKTFRNEYSLQIHLNQDHLDSDGKPTVGYKCKKCKKILGCQQSLKEHLYTHTGKKPYKCNEPGCGKYFRQSSQLSYHKRIHSEVKKYLTGSCPKRSKKNLDDFKLEKVLESSQTEIFTEYLELPKIGDHQIEVKLPNIFERLLVL